MLRRLSTARRSLAGFHDCGCRPVHPPRSLANPLVLRPVLLLPAHSWTILRCTATGTATRASSIATTTGPAARAIGFHNRRGSNQSLHGGRGREREKKQKNEGRKDGKK